MTKPEEATTNLPAVLSDSAQSFLNEVPSQGGSSLPFKRLVMVQEMGKTTPEGLDIPTGSFYIADTEVFGAEVTIRPIKVVSKIMARSTSPEDNYRVLSETIYFQDWFNTERIDSVGGVDCGRVFGKASKELSPEQQKVNKEKATLYVHVFAMATIGDSDPELVLFSVSGSKSMRINNALQQKGITDYRKRNFKLTSVLPTKDPELSDAQRKLAQNKFYNLTVRPDMTVEFTLVSIAKQGGIIWDFVKNHNEVIKNKHIDAVEGRTHNSIHDNASSIYDADFEEINDLH